MNSDQLTLMSFLRRAVALFPDREIVTRTLAGDVTISYQGFVARVHRLAHVLRDLGVQPGDRVATLAWNNQRHLELYFAIPCTGAVLHTVNLRLAAEQIAEMVEHAGDAILFVDEDKLDLARQALTAVERPPRIIVLAAAATGSERKGQAAYEELMAAASAQPSPFPELDERQAAATCYSSATTGRPKGVVYSHRSLYLHSMALGMADTWALSEADTILPVVPMFHVHAWGLPFAAIWLGSRIILPGTAPGPEQLADLMAVQSVTFAAAVPTVWLAVLSVLSERGWRLPAARLFVSGGAPLPAALLAQADRAGLPLIHSYGMTEATPLVLVGRMKSTLASEPAAAGFARRLRQGLPVPGVEVAVITEDGRPAAHDGAEIGELRIRGPWVAEEYERDPRGDEVFTGGWFRTGDIVSVDEQAYVKIVDRPADDELRRYLGARFPKWWLPERFIRLDALPLTSVGKYDKRGLRSLLAAGPAVRPGTP